MSDLLSAQVQELWKAGEGLISIARADSLCAVGASGTGLEIGYWKHLDPHSG